MQDMIKTYKPKRSKKIVRRQAGKSIAKGLGSVGAGAALGHLTRNVDFWPEGSDASKLERMAAETAVAYTGSKAIQNKKLRKYLRDLAKKAGPDVLKRMGTGFLRGGIVPSLLAGGYTLAQMGPEFSIFIPQLTGDTTWKKQGYDSPEEFQIDALKLIPGILEEGVDYVGERRRQVHKKGSTKYKKEHPHLYDTKGKSKGMLAGRAEKREKRKQEVKKKLKAKKSGDKFVAGHYD